MKQDPILPSIHVSAMQIPPKRMVPYLGKMGSSDHMAGETLLAFVLHGLCVLVALWCMTIPKQDNPLHSTIEVAFEAPIALPVPQEVEDINQDALPIPVKEPSILAFETLPPIDSIAPLSIPNAQKTAFEKKNTNSQFSQNQLRQQSNMENAFEKTQFASTSQSQAVKPSVKSVNKYLSPAQRCSALSNEYPMAARRRHEQGMVQVSYQLLADGQIKQVEVIESSGFSDLDHAAVEAVQNMKCQAVSEQPVVKTTIPVYFSLNKIN